MNDRPSFEPQDLITKTVKMAFEKKKNQFEMNTNSFYLS
jgi:hypothetical protein